MNTFISIWASIKCVFNSLFKRPGVAGAVLQSPPLLINSFGRWSFLSESSRHCRCQTVRAGELQFWENVNPSPFVTWPVSFLWLSLSGEGLLSTGPTRSSLGVTLTWQIFFLRKKILDKDTLHIRVLCYLWNLSLFWNLENLEPVIILDPVNILEPVIILTPCDFCYLWVFWLFGSHAGVPFFCLCLLPVFSAQA